MDWIFAGLAGIGFVELLIRLPVMPTLARLRALVGRVAWVIRAPRISDHWKERALPRYALRLMGLTLALGAYLAAAFIPFALLYALSLAVDVAFLPFTLSATGLVFMTVYSLLYAKLRVRRVRPARL